MLANKSKTAIIAGKGDLVTSYIDIIKSKKTNFVVIAIDNFFSCKKYKPNFSLNFNNIGNIFNILYEEKITNVVFLGALKKPSIIKLRPNLNTLYYLFLISIENSFFLLSSLYLKIRSSVPFLFSVKIILLPLTIIACPLSFFPKFFVNLKQFFI